MKSVQPLAIVWFSPLVESIWTSVGVSLDICYSMQ
jgi:hypothetical protein